MIGLFRMFASICIVTLLLGSAGCKRGTPAEPKVGGKGLQASGKKLKVAFVYVGPIGDAGWTYAHDQGRRALEKEFPGLKTTYLEKVKEGPEAERRIEQLARHGYDVIFTTSFGFMDPTLRVAKRYPKVLFMHCSGYKRAKNVGTYFGRMYQPKYLSGLIAGKMSKSGIIGYVAPHPIPEVIRHINAFAIGVREINPKAQVRVVWINSWFNPSKEKEAAASLIDAGADIVATGADSPAPMQAAQARGKLAFGYDSDNRKAAPKAFLTAPIWDWTRVYFDIIRKVRAGKAGDLSKVDYYHGLGNGVVKLAPLSDKVSQAARKIVASRRRSIVAGKFKVFAGPVVRQDGSTAIPKGRAATVKELLTMAWFVKGVVGTIPKKKGKK